MKIHMYENDPRFKMDPNFLNNCGSFSVIIHNLNNELKLRGLYADIESADWVGFATGLDLNFYPNLKPNQKRFVIGVWESNVLPDYLFQARKALEGPNYKFLALSKQYADLMDSYGFGSTPIVDIGVGDFWDRSKPQLRFQKDEVFKILSVTANNFRSGIDTIVNAFIDLSSLFGKSKYELIIKDTEERNNRLKEICGELRQNDYQINYICERWDNQKLKQLMEESHLLCYLVSCTSGGLPILNAARLKLPCIVGDFSPVNLYPSSAAIRSFQFPISEFKNVLTSETERGSWGLPYTFPPNWIDENKALLNVCGHGEVALKIEQIYNNYAYYARKAEKNYQEVKQNWSWSNSCDQLLEALK
jgi:glycosyltransferase involved in cell wall biosynthesis